MNGEAIMRRGPGYWLLVAGASVWLATTVAAPWARAQGYDWAFVPYLFFSGACHQIAERSFAAFGHPLAVCHRCFGLYAGFLLGLLAFPYTTRLSHWLREEPRRLLWFALPMAIDWLLLSRNVWWSRTATGFLAALPIALLAWIAVQEIATSLKARRLARGMAASAKPG